MAVLAVVSVLGKDQKGVVAQFATYMAKRGINIPVIPVLVGWLLIHELHYDLRHRDPEQCRRDDELRRHVGHVDGDAGDERHAGPGPCRGQSRRQTAFASVEVTWAAPPAAGVAPSGTTARAESFPSGV